MTVLYSLSVYVTNKKLCKVSSDEHAWAEDGSGIPSQMQ